MTAATKAVLLAAGRGNRLAPHTDHTPKPMLPLAGKPLLEYLICNLRPIGISQILVVTGYLGEQIQAHFGDGTAWDVELHYIDQSQQQGTGAATLLAESFVGEDAFFLGWGDIISATADFEYLATEFSQTPSSGLLLLNYEEDPHTGAAVYLEGHRITSIHEKPPPGSSATHWNQAGASMFTPAIFPCLRQLPLSERGEIEFTGAVQALIEDGHTVGGLPMQHPRLHLSYPEDIASVEETLRNDSRYLPSADESA